MTDMITDPTMTDVTAVASVSVEVKDDKDQMTLTSLLDLSDDVKDQPDWRTPANVACKYYDGDQLEPSVVAKLRERGQPITIHNLIAPTVDGVLGMEAKTRTDLLVIADDPDEKMEQMCEAVNSEFADACRLGGMNKARSDAYAEQIKAGLSWVEVRRNSDPFGPRYKMSTVHRNEIWWDWFSREPDLSDCRWLMRKRWLDVDEARARFPKQKEMIDHAIHDWQDFINTDLYEGHEPHLINGYDEWKQYTTKDMNWVSGNRKRILLQVVYYRTYTSMDVLLFDNGRSVQYDKQNIMHVVAAATGKVKLVNAPVSRIREAWFIGPHRIVDRRCTAPQGMFPLIPFWGYRKDENGAPYGLVSRAIPAQNEVNFRRMKLTWLLQAKRIIMDGDATNMSDAELQHEVERGDGIIKLNPQRQNKTTIASSFEVQQDFNIASQQFSVMQESMKLIQDGMGVYSAFLGQDSSAKSGVAISNLVEQGATTLAEINDNYQFACQQVGQLLLSYLLEDLKDKRDYDVTINRDDPRKRKRVTINATVTGQPTLNNDINLLRAHIALAPIQQTPAYKSQLAERLSQVIIGLPPQLQVSVLDMWLDLLDIPNKQEFVERIRAAAGTPKSPDEMTPEEQQAAQAQAQAQQAQMELAMREQQAKVSKLEAEAQRLAAQVAEYQANANSQRFDDAKTQAETAKIVSEINNWNAQADQLQQEFSNTLDQALNDLPVPVAPMQNQPVATQQDMR